MEELELGEYVDGAYREIIRVIKEGTVEEYSSYRYTRQSTPTPTWKETTYVGALIGKSAKAAQGAYSAKSKNLGDPVLGLEGE